MTVATIVIRISVDVQTNQRHGPRTEENWCKSQTQSWSHSHGSSSGTANRKSEQRGQTDEEGQSRDTK